MEEEGEEDLEPCEWTASKNGQIQITWNVSRKAENREYRRSIIVKLLGADDSK